MCSDLFYFLLFIYLFFIYFYFIFIFYFIASKTHTEKKQKLHRINKVIKTKNKKNKQTNSEFTHLHGNILTNIKICYSSANSIYYCT